MYRAVCSAHTYREVIKMSNSSKQNDKRIKCDAKNCIHNSADCRCTADSIKVGCSSACTCDETACKTFELSSTAD